MSEQHVLLLFEGWQVWDGTYGPIRVGEEFEASVEFVEQSALRPPTPGTRTGLEHIADNRYQAIAEVLDTTDAIVLDLGGLRALRWIRPGETAVSYVRGEEVALDLSLNLNPWDNTPWTNNAAKMHDTDHRWRVHRIVRRIPGREGFEEISEASTDSVESAGQYCLLDCTRIDSD